MQKKHMKPIIKMNKIVVHSLSWEKILPGIYIYISCTCFCSGLFIYTYLDGKQLEVLPVLTQSE